jgi:hypothetical protein
MRWTCIQTASLVGARSFDLGTAQRLALEDHLTGCVACRETAQLGSRFREMLDAQTAPPPSIDRTIHRALREVARDESPRATSRMMPRIAAVSAVALAAAAAVMLWPAREPIAHQQEAADMPIPAGQVAQLGHGRVTLMGDAMWMSSMSTVVLRHGSVLVAVDPRPHLPFAVQTGRFVVEVRGTRFRVDANGVDVYEGHVRIRDLAGSVLVESLGAGEHWRVSVPPPVVVAVPPAPAPVHQLEAPSRIVSTAAPHLARARTHLASKDIEAARRELALALDANPTRTQRATAAVLAADASFVEGDTKHAIALYREAHAEYADLLAGQNALFAAARLQMKIGPAAEARELLEQYLEHYPHGEFSIDATTRLHDLATR